MEHEQKKGKWSEEENMKLVFFYAHEKKKTKNGIISWTSVSKNILNRTPHQCRVHFKILTNNNSFELINMKIKERQEMKAFICKVQLELAGLQSVEFHRNVCL
jgi:hypothetical protein